MKHICSFCNKELSPPTGDDNLISHGICLPCFNHAKASLGVNLKEYLNMLDKPVFLVDPDMHVLGANTLSLQMTGKQIQNITGHLSGEVFECENAILPGGCGETIHCSGCVIRNSVNETYKTGVPVTRRPATLNHNYSRLPSSVDLYITTKKAGEVVLLVVEPVE